MGAAPRHAKVVFDSDGNRLARVGFRGTVDLLIASPPFTLLSIVFFACAVLSSGALLGRVHSIAGISKAVLFICIIVMSVVVIWDRRPAISSLPLESFALWAVLTAAVFVSVGYAKQDYGNGELWSFIVLFAILPPFLCLLHKYHYLEHFVIVGSNIVAGLTAVGLVLWLFGATLGIIDVNCVIDNTWNGRGRLLKAQGYYHLCYLTQTVDVFGGSFWRFTGLFVEAPICSFVMCISILLEWFCVDRRRKWVLGTLAVGVLCSVSTTGYIFLFLLFLFESVGHIRQRKQMPYATVAIVSCVVILSAALAVVLGQKVLSGGISTRIDDYVAGYLAWNNDFFFGNGFSNSAAITEVMSSSRFGNRGFSNGLFYVLARGGLVFLLPFIVAFAGFFIPRSRKWTSFGLLFIFLWVVTRAPFFPFTALGLSFGIARLQLAYSALTGVVSGVPSNKDERHPTAHASRRRSFSMSRRKSVAYAVVSAVLLSVVLLGAAVADRSLVATQSFTPGQLLRVSASGEAPVGEDGETAYLAVDAAGNAMSSDAGDAGEDGAIGKAVSGVWKGGSARSNHYHGGVRVEDDDPNTFASPLGGGTMRVQRKKLFFDNASQIEWGKAAYDDSGTKLFAWAATQGTEDGENIVSENGEISNLTVITPGKDAATETKENAIVYLGPLDKNTEKTYGGAEDDGYVFRVRFPEAVLLRNGDSADLVMTYQSITLVANRYLNVRRNGNGSVYFDHSNRTVPDCAVVDEHGVVISGDTPMAIARSNAFGVECRYGYYDADNPESAPDDGRVWFVGNGGYGLDNNSWLSPDSLKSKGGTKVMGRNNYRPAPCMLGVKVTCRLCVVRSGGSPDDVADCIDGSYVFSARDLDASDYGIARDKIDTQSIYSGWAYADNAEMRYGIENEDGSYFFTNKDGITTWAQAVERVGEARLAEEGWEPCEVEGEHLAAVKRNGGLFFMYNDVGPKYYGEVSPSVWKRKDSQCISTNVDYSPTSYSEAVAVDNGALSYALVPDGNFLQIEGEGENGTANGLRFVATQADAGTYDSGFAVLLDAKGATLSWTSSGPPNASSLLFGL